MPAREAKKPLREVPDGRVGKTKVLILIDSLLPGGAETSLLLCLPHLREKGIEPILVCLKRREPNLEPLAIELGFAPVYLTGLSSRRWYFRFPRWLISFRKLIDAIQPDLVHATLFQSCLVSRFGCSGTGVPLLNSVVNLDYSPKRLEDPSVRGSQSLRKAKMLTLKGLNRVTAGRVTHFHAVTPAVRDAACRDLGITRERTSVVFRGRPLKFAGVCRRETLLAELGLSPSSKLILNVGRQDYQKGQAELVKAIPRILEHHPQAVLLVAGRQGTMTSILSQLVTELGLADNIRFLGHRTDVPDLLASCDVFCLPSLYEGAAGAAVEAMVAGKPIVATRLTEFDGILTHQLDALLVGEKNSSELASAISSVLRSPEVAKRLGLAARKSFEQKFSLAKSVEGLASLYCKVAGGEQIRIY